jgi:ribosomal protein L37AE/L43A
MIRELLLDGFVVGQVFTLGWAPAQAMVSELHGCAACSNTGFLRAAEGTWRPCCPNDACGQRRAQTCWPFAPASKASPPQARDALRTRQSAKVGGRGGSEFADR